MFDLQCCVSAVEQIKLVFRLFSHIGHYRVLSRFPCAIHRSFLVIYFIYCCSFARFFVTPWTAATQASLSFPISQNLLNSCPLSWWCHPTPFSSVVPFFCFPPFPASGSLPVRQLFASGGQSGRASASVLLMDIQVLFPLGLTGLICLLSKGLSRVFTQFRKHQFLGAQPSWLFNSHIHTWLLEKP